MRDLIQKIDNILKESSEQHTGLFQVGDEFGISFSENLEIATTIVGFVEDGIVVALDDKAIGIMEDNGARFFDGYLEEGLRDPKDNPCWKGYKPVGTKKKNGKTVPNCVPKESIEESSNDALDALTRSSDDDQEEVLNLLKQFITSKSDPEDKQDLIKVYKAFQQSLGQGFEVLSHQWGTNLDSQFYRFAKTQGVDLPVIARRITGESDGASEEDLDIDEAEYQGRDVPLGKKMAGDVKKYKVYVKNPKGNVVKVNFGDKKMRIKKSNPERRKSFRARHNCDNPGPRTSARYWSCKNW